MLSARFADQRRSLCHWTNTLVSWGVTMKYIFVLVVGFCCAATQCRAQITAFTSDGRKVLLSPDGTWKYVFEDDGRKVILNPDGTWRYADDTVRKAVAVSTIASTIDGTPAPVDTTRKVVAVAAVKPPVKKAPLNLDCGALVAVERSIQGDKFVAQSKTIKVNSDTTAGFSISFYKTKNGPLIWTIAMNAKGYCIEEENKMMIVMKDGTRFQVVNNGKPNCDGNFKLYFGGTYGHELQLESLTNKEVAAIRVWTSNSYVEENFTDDHSALFKASISCMMSTK